MTAVETVDRVLEEVEFTAPVSLDDVVEVHRRIESRLPPGAKLESYHRIRDVVFEVRSGALTIHRRVMPVTGAR